MDVAEVEGARLLPLTPMGNLLRRMKSRGRTGSRGRSSRRSRRPQQPLSLLHDGVERLLLLLLLLLQRRRERRRKSGLYLLGVCRHGDPCRRGRRVGVLMVEKKQQQQQQQR